MTVFTKLTLPEMLVESAAVAADAQRAFGEFNAEQLNWKPGADEWSVAQCLEHLMATNQAMFPAMDEALTSPKRTGFLERLPVLPGLCGKLMVKIVSPGFKQKLTAPPSARPAASAIDAQVVNRFVTQQCEITERINKLERLKAAQIVMTSPFVSLINYSLLDACRLIVAHERRHLAQAQRVMETPVFPR